MSPDLDYVALLPEIALSVTLVAVLAADLLLPRTRKYWVAIVALVGVSLTAIPLIYLAIDGDLPAVMVDGGYVVDEFALALKGLFVVAGYLVLLMSVSYIESERYYQGEYYFLLVASILGSVVMASSRDLITLFIGLELVTGPLFLLAGWRKGDVKSNEASLKFFLIGVLSTALLLWGMSFLYGLTGTVDFAGLAAASGDLVDNPAFVLAVLFVMVGFAFKVTAAPFHWWAPDTYEGAPTPVTAYLSVSSKAAGFVGLLLITYLALPDAASIWGPALWLLAVVSMTLGNLSALRQRNIVRLLAYSSVAQAGFMMVPFAGAAVDGSDLGAAVTATVTYLMIYSIMNLGAFAVVIAGARKTGTGELDGWAGLGSYAPGLGLAVALFFFSLAGIPPLAGWFAKFVMFSTVIGTGNPWTLALAVIAAINTVIALVYYARVAKVVWMDPTPETVPEGRDRPVAASLGLVLGIAAVIIVVLGFLPGIVAGFADATRVIVAGG